MTVGKKASDYFKYKKIPVAFDKHTLLDKLDYNEIVDTADFLISKYISGDYDRIELVYNQFKNAAVQITSVEAFLPVELKAIAGKGYRNEYFFEPSLHFLVRELIPKTLRTQFYKALLDSNAAEHGARMTAMHQATDNATELLRELKINYNKARQTSITNEIVEIISGAEAQKK
jgi:F-type H+-transporting ATPase subunit gamma